MSVNKIKIIEKVLKLNPKSYKKIERLLSLAENLDFDAEDKHLLEFEVVNCAINSAFEVCKEIFILICCVTGYFRIFIFNRYNVI